MGNRVHGPTALPRSNTSITYYMIGILEFNNEKVDLAKYAKFLSSYKAKGKDKRVLVEMVNYTPMMVGGAPTKGIVHKFGGQKAVMPYETVMFPKKTNPTTGEVMEWEEGILRYYERKDPSQHPMGAPKFSPERLFFRSGKMLIQSENDAMLMFMVLSGKNTGNQSKIEDGKEVGWSRMPSIWRIIKPGESAGKNAKKLNLKFDAMQRVKIALIDKQEIAKQLYEAQGNTDWGMYLTFNTTTKKWEGDFREIENVLLTIADNDPQKIVNLLSDTALDIRSKIVMALNLDILGQESDMWFWGAKASGGKYKDKPAKDKTIVKIPAGKASSQEEIMEWFADFLKGEPSIMIELNGEISKSEKLN